MAVSFSFDWCKPSLPVLLLKDEAISNGNRMGLLRFARNDTPDRGKKKKEGLSPLVNAC